MTAFTKVAQLGTVDDLRAHLAGLGVGLELDDELEVGPAAPLAQPLEVGGRTLGNRMSILPMEGWDATADGLPSDLVKRRWRRFGASGAKLIWGGEAVAVRPDGRANPHQLLAAPDRVAAFAELRRELVDAHVDRFGNRSGLLVGLQLTHSGRFARPSGTPEPRIAYRHPWLDDLVDVESDRAVLDDRDVAAYVEDFVSAAVMAHQAGFDFVDVKHCHGYLGHEFLSALERPGPYGGSLEGRTRFLREIVAGIRAKAPDLMVAVRLSAFDFCPYSGGFDQAGQPNAGGDYRYAFGGDGSGSGVDLDEPGRFCALLRELGVGLVCVTAGSPYYNPHIQRPAYFPPSDGYLPPEDPFFGVARMLQAAADLKRQHPDLVFVGSGLSYLQQWLPHVAQRAVREGLVDCIGLGRMALSYPSMPADVLAGRELQRRLICRTFSDCTTAPRHQLVSGCYPLDEHYKQMPEAAQLKAIKREIKRGDGSNEPGDEG